MAITQIGVKPKEEENGWDKISKVMGFANTALSLGSDVSSLLNPADKMLQEIPKTGLDTAPAAALKMDNSLQRRLYGRIA